MQKKNKQYCPIIQITEHRMRIRDRLKPVVSTQMAPPSESQLRRTNWLAELHTHQIHMKMIVCKAKLFNFRTWVFARKFFDNFLVVADFSLCKDRARNNNKPSRRFDGFSDTALEKGRIGVRGVCVVWSAGALPFFPSKESAFNWICGLVLCETRPSTPLQPLG